MKEATIVFPKDDDDHANKAARGLLQQRLYTTFGGWTSHDGFGAWEDGEGNPHMEPVTIYNVAVPHHPDFGTPEKELLREYALEAGWRAGEKAVYIRYSDGTVAIEQVSDTLKAKSEKRRAEASLPKVEEPMTIDSVI